MTATGFLGELWGRRSFVANRVVDDPVEVVDQEDARRIPTGAPGDDADRVTTVVPIVMERITIRHWKLAMVCSRCIPTVTAFFEVPRITTLVNEPILSCPAR